MWLQSLLHSLRGAAGVNLIVHRGARSYSSFMTRSHAKGGSCVDHGRGGITRMRPVQKRFMLGAHCAPRLPHGAVALEAAAERDLPDAVAALNALRAWD